MTPREIVDSLANDEAALRELVGLISAMQGASKPAEAVYTSLSLPPDCPSRSRFRQIAPGLKGAYKSGKCWVVARIEWEKFRGAMRPSRQLSDDELAELSLKKAGYRRTK